jgi:hypothetical protein
LRGESKVRSKRPKAKERAKALLVHEFEYEQAIKKSHTN